MTPPNLLLGHAYGDGYPVVGITFSAAQEYARWHAAENGRPSRLPLAREWLRAARGEAGRVYPWGWTFEPAYCVWGGGWLGGRPQPVGRAPQDRTLAGVSDLAGSVSEWLLDASDSGPYRRLVAGGSWSSPAGATDLGTLRARAESRPGTDLGFRLVMSLPSL